MGSQASIADAAGISRSTLSQMLKKGGDVTVSRLARIAQTIGVSLDWIVFGEGASAPGRPDTMLVPILENVEVSAGPGSAAVDRPSVGEMLVLPTTWVRERGPASTDLQTVRVRGGSMEPTLNDGDLVIIDPHRLERIDGLFVLMFHEQLVVKRIQFQASRLMVISDHVGYDSAYVTGEEQNQANIFRLVGRVIGTVRRVA